MVALLPSFRVLAVFCTLAFAAPATHLASRDAHPHTHHVRTLPNGLELRSFHTPSTFQLFDRGIDHPLSKRAEPAPLREAGMTFIKERLGDEAVWRATLARNASTSNVYAFQEINGIAVATTVANVAINKAGQVSAWSSNFVTSKTAPPTKPKIAADAAVAAATSSLTGTATGSETTLKYYPREDGTLALTYAADLKLNGNAHTVRAFVDAETGDVIGMIDYTSNVNYRVSPITAQDPSVDFDLLVDPEDLQASPDRWTVLNGVETNSTSGNNAVAFIGAVGNVGAQSAPGVFDFDLDLNADPTQGENQNAAVTNAFFVTNTAHDIFYRYGFTEDAFNFQDSNLGLGGEEGDRVLISVQDASGTDNAQFTTPPDGQAGLMQMFLFVSTDPVKDGSMTNDVVAHEFTHGVTSRLTGGGTAECLQTLESGGLGEGWSDAFPDWLSQQSGQVEDFSVGEFLFPGGIRTAPYSLDRNVNSLTFSDVASLVEVHEIGEVWAQTLHVANAALIQANGFAADAFTNPDGAGGNTVWMHLFVDALAIQPCNPTFLDARAAWVQADVDRFAGANACTLWTAFSSMGLGPDAAPGQDDFSVPASCGGTGGEVASTGTGSSTGSTGTTTGNGNGNGGRGGRRGGRRNQGFVAHGHKH